MAHTQRVTHQNHRRYNQQGVVLIMSLVILLVLTLLGVAAMRSSNLQIVMSGNSQFQVEALSNAESTLNEAFIKVESFAAAGLPGAVSWFYDITGGTYQDPLTYDWATNPGFPAASGAYYIEYAGPETPPGESVGGYKVYVYRLTALSTSSRGASRTLQSVYVTNQAPF